MKKYRVIFMKDENGLIPIEYTDAADEDLDMYFNIIARSLVNEYIKDIPVDSKVEAGYKFLENLVLGVSDKEFEIKLPHWCKEACDDYDFVAYMVIDKTKKDEDIVTGLYASEADAWHATHELISDNDAEIYEDKPYYYKRFFKLLIKDVAPIGEAMFAKYDYEKMEFDI